MTVTIDVTSINDAPAGADNTLTTSEDTTLTITAPNFGFSDVDGNAFNRVKITTLPAAGTLKLNGTAVSAGDFVTKAQLDVNQLTFDPAVNANGAGYASFTFQVEDDGGTANGGVNLDASANTFTINVTSVNDAPINTVPGGQSATEAMSLAISGLSISDVDVDETVGGEFVVTLSVANGSLTVVNSGLSSLIGNGTGSVVLTGSLSSINATLNNNVTYLGNFGFAGTDTLTITTNDQGNTGTDPGTSGNATNEQDSDTVAITVTALAENSVTVIDCFCGGGGKALLVKGSSLDDKIEVKFGSVAGKYKVTIKSGSMAGSMNMGSFKFGGVDSAINKVIVYGLDGNDDIKVASNLNINAWLFGGGGNDKLRGGDFADVLVGGDGDDMLDGKQGRDILIGGDGADKMKGDKNEDILIAGWTGYDNNLAALCGIQDEWTSANSFEDRVNNVFNGGGAAAGANGSYFFNSSTVQVSDGDKDELNGGSGSDWFIADETGDGDKVKGFDDDEDIFGLAADWFNN